MQMATAVDKCSVQFSHLVSVAARFPEEKTAYIIHKQIFKKLAKNFMLQDKEIIIIIICQEYRTVKTWVLIQDIYP